MIKVSDFIFQYLVEKHNIEHCFLVVGGGAMHLNDSLGRTKGLHYICNHHEQASAIAGEGYYRTSGKLCITSVTTGPGGTNAITGVLGQWLDSIPGLYISGQVKQSTTIASCPGLKLRQLGDQEADIINIVKPITKYSVCVSNPNEIKYEIDKSIAIALNGRPGPVWIDIPLDVQGAMIDQDNLKEFFINELSDDIDFNIIDSQIRILLEKIESARSPLFYVGNGIRLCNRVEEFINIAEQLRIPVVTAISGSDVIWHDHPLFFGKPGICGDRIGNIMVQNSDLLIIIGTRLSIRQVGYAYELLAPKAFKVMVDIDRAELEKPTLLIDLKIHANLNIFIDTLLEYLQSFSSPKYNEWISWGRKIESDLPTIFEDNPSQKGYISSYVFTNELFKQLSSGDVVVTGNGTAYTSTYQSMKVKKGVRVFANQGCAAMGYDLPAAIGACVANKKGKTILITGDGSIQMNIQELQTIVTNNLPIKIFLLENEGYLAIKTTQNTYFQGRFIGSNPKSGITCPDMDKIAHAYGIPFVRIREEIDLFNTIQKVLNNEGYIICEIKMHPEQSLYPKSASIMDKNGKMTSAPLDQMAPFINESLQLKCFFHSK